MIEIKCDICGGLVVGAHDEDRGPVYSHGWINNTVTLKDMVLVVGFTVQSKNNKGDICYKCGWEAVRKVFEKMAGQKGLFE